jgi:hypothetical protein
MGVKSSQSSRLSATPRLPIKSLLPPVSHPFGHEPVTLLTWEALQQCDSITSILQNALLHIIMDYLVHIRMVVVSHERMWSCHIHSLLAPLTSLTEPTSGIWVACDIPTKDIYPQTMICYNNELILWPLTDHNHYSYHLSLSHLLPSTSSPSQGASPSSSSSSEALLTNSSLSSPPPSSGSSSSPLSSAATTNSTSKTLERCEWRIANHGKTTLELYNSVYRITTPAVALIPVASLENSNNNNEKKDNVNSGYYDRMMHLFCGSHGVYTLNTHTIFDGKCMEYAPNVYSPAPREDMLVAVDHQRMYLVSGRI